MSFYSDTSFFVLLVPIMCGAAFLGLRERPLGRYGLVVSLLMLACLFCKTPVQAAYAACYLAVATVGSGSSAIPEAADALPSRSPACWFPWWPAR